MADEKDNASETQAGGEMPQDFEKWVAEQPENIQTLYSTHLSGLKNALGTERSARKAFEKAKKDAEQEAAKEDAKKLEEKEEYRQLAEQRQAAIEALEIEKAELAQEILVQRSRRAFREEASKQKLIWASETAAADAFMTLDLKSIGYDDAGDLRGLDAVVKTLSKERPYFFKTAQAPSNISAGAGRGAGGTADAPRSDQLKVRFGI